MGGGPGRDPGREARGNRGGGGGEGAGDRDMVTGTDEGGGKLSDKGRGLKVD